MVRPVGPIYKPFYKKESREPAYPPSIKCRYCGFTVPFNSVGARSYAYRRLEAHVRDQHRAEYRQIADARHREYGASGNCQQGFP